MLRFDWYQPAAGRALKWRILDSCVVIRLGPTRRPPTTIHHAHGCKHPYVTGPPPLPRAGAPVRPTVENRLEGTVHTKHPESDVHASRHGFRRFFGVAVAALIGSMIWAGDGGVTEAIASGECTEAEPGARDYCASDRCGLCAEGEGDCDPGQCQAGLTCVEEGAVDHCRPEEVGSSNFQVKIDGVWQGVCCIGGVLEVSDQDCWWTEHNRVLTDETAGLKLDCPEGGPTGCECNSSGEPMHGTGGGDLRDFWAPNGALMYPNDGMETCVEVGDDGELFTDWTGSSCPRYRFD